MNTNKNPPVEQLFIIDEEATLARRYRVNDALVLKFVSLYEASAYYLEAIRFWEETHSRSLFCGGVNMERKEVDPFYYGSLPMPIVPNKLGTFKVPSTCSACERAKHVVEKVFGSLEVFEEAPFVVPRPCASSREVKVNITALEVFVEKGYEGLLWSWIQQLNRLTREINSIMGGRIWLAAKQTLRHGTRWSKPPSLTE